MNYFTLFLGVVALIVAITVTIKYARKWKRQRDEQAGVQEDEDNGDSNEEV